LPAKCLVFVKDAMLTFVWEPLLLWQKDLDFTVCCDEKYRQQNLLGHWVVNFHVVSVCQSSQKTHLLPTSRSLFYQDLTIFKNYHRSKCVFWVTFGTCLVVRKRCFQVKDSVCYNHYFLQHVPNTLLENVHECLAFDLF